MKEAFLYAVIAILLHQMAEGCAGRRLDQVLTFTALRLVSLVCTGMALWVLTLYMMKLP